MLRFYKFNSVKKTTEKYGISASQLTRYASGMVTHIKPIKQVKNGEVIRIFDTQKEASAYIGVSVNSCLKGRTKTAGGYEWYYVTQEEYEDYEKRDRV